MIENLTICHIKKDARKNARQEMPFMPTHDWSLFETCQRKIFISLTPAVNLPQTPPKSIIKGSPAYSVLLNILCGLESRVAGETEVFGQFKIFVSRQDIKAPSWFNQFRRIAQDLIADVKKVRNNHLGDVGLRSYGSLTKSYVNDYQNLAIIGGGQLAQKTLPYLNDGKHQIDIYLRSIAKAAQIPERLTKNINIHALTEQKPPLPFQGLIIAAPLTSEQIEQWLKKAEAKPLIIIDLREQNSDNRLNVDCKLVTLDDLFIEIEKTSKLFQVHIEAARKHILALTQERISVRHFRPFGWEDICA